MCEYLGSEMERYCAGAGVFVVEICIMACAVASVIILVASVQLRRVPRSAREDTGVCRLLIASRNCAVVPVLCCMSLAGALVCTSLGGPACPDRQLH